jgi:hypothetical protein
MQRVLPDRLILGLFLNHGLPAPCQQDQPGDQADTHTMSLQKKGGDHFDPRRRSGLGLRAIVA